MKRSPESAGSVGGVGGRWTKWMVEEHCIVHNVDDLDNIQRLPFSYPYPEISDATSRWPELTVHDQQPQNQSPSVVSEQNCITKVHGRKIAWSTTSSASRPYLL